MTEEELQLIERNFDYAMKCGDCSFPFTDDVIRLIAEVRRLNTFKGAQDVIAATVFNNAFNEAKPKTES